MSKSFVRTLVLAGFAVALVPATARAQAIHPDVQAYLTQGGFTPADLAALAGGQVISRVESGPADTELIAIGAAKIRTDRQQTARYFGQMVTYVDGTVTMGFGKFSAPPVEGDVKGLAFERADIDALKSCKPGSCDIRIAGAGIDKARRSIDWKAPDAYEQAQNALRKAAVDYVSAYMQRGDEALITYNDQSAPVSLKAEWQGLLANSPRMQEILPKLRDYAVQYPRAPLAGAKDVIYWIKENYGLKPTVSLVHAVIYDAPERPDRTTILQKYIYASHYYDASAAVTMLIDGVEAGKPITWMVYANRSRGDMLRGGFGGIKRKVARDQAKKATQETLKTIQVQLEQAAGLR